MAGLVLGGCRATGSAHVRARAIPLPQQVRAVWVARFHYHFPEDIRTIVRNCAEFGCNTIFWQVRGNGTTSYPSRLEPWSAEYGYRDPGFDPLRIAVDEAHRRGLRIEAWINVMPGWRGPQPPPAANQLWNTHPEWFLHDANGQRQPLVAQYVILNPCLPEVREYITDVIDEVAHNYDVDGIHLDYVRYAWDTLPNARKLYPRDARTVALFRTETGHNPNDDPAAWDHWRANQITRLVTMIRQRVFAHRRGMSLTAAVWADPQRGYQDYLQNAIAWLRTGLVDAVVPMAYTDQVENFERNITAYRNLAPRAHVIPGVGLYRLDKPQEVVVQLERCQAWGGDYALFSYESLAASAGDRGADGRGRVDPRTHELRQMRRAIVEPFGKR